MLGQKSQFDVTAELAAGQSEAEILTASAFFPGESLTVETFSGKFSLSKQFATGLQSRLSLQGDRTEGGSSDFLSDQLDPAYQANMVLDLTQPLLKDFGWNANLAGINAAQIRKKQAALSYLGRAVQLVAEIEAAYLELAKAQEEYRHYTLARDLAQELLDGNELKLDAGLIPVTEVNEARSALAGREESMLLAQQGVLLAHNSLIDLLHEPEISQSEDLQVEFPKLDNSVFPELEEALSQGLNKRPDLLQMRLETDIRQIELDYADNQLWPRLDLEGSYALNGLAGDDQGAGSVYAGDWNDALSGAFDRDGTQWYAGLRLTMPLQNRAARAAYDSSRVSKRQTLYQLQRREIATETAIRSAHATTELGAKRYEVAKRYAALAEETLEQENQRLDEGLSDTFRVLSFQNALITARIREISAKVDYYKALSTLFAAMGTNLERYEIVAALPRIGAE
ncbi:MAG: hypothetical protein C0623_12695 [Desulfuromonas sp.]|nr:MAG: hypothetical protein C0623_12695 [Desulfuromonas sp.]